MGQRGPGAKPIKRPDAGANVLPLFPNDDHAAKCSMVHPWEVEGLSRVDRVVAFLESLPITSGALAGETMVVRPWQREFLEAVYSEDANAVRHVRTAVLSMARKQG